jgi:hypothetical protein
LDVTHPYFVHEVGWSSAFLVASVIVLSYVGAISHFLVTHLAWVVGSFEYRLQFSHPPKNSKKMRVEACVTCIKWLAMASIILTSALCAKGQSSVRVTPHQSASLRSFLNLFIPVSFLFCYVYEDCKMLGSQSKWPSNFFLCAFAFCV